MHVFYKKSDDVLKSLQGNNWKRRVEEWKEEAQGRLRKKERIKAQRQSRREKREWGNEVKWTGVC